MRAPMGAPSVSTRTRPPSPQPLLRAFLGQAGVDLYAQTPLRQLRVLARQLLEQGVPVTLKPAHPLLHRHTRGQTALRVTPGRVLRGADVYDVAQRLKGAGLLFDEATRVAFVPFENTRSCLLTRTRTRT